MTNRVAFVYPGQGSQFVGMGKDLPDFSPKARELFEIAAGVMGDDFMRVMFEGPEETLKQTLYTQPAVIIFTVALHEMLCEAGIRPSIVAGHSLGEYMAMYAARMIEFKPLLELVKLRAELMQRIGEEEPGTMAAIMGLDDSRLAEMCAATGGNMFVANFNAPGQTVISGKREAMEAFLEQCRAAGAKRALQLPVSGAFHCPMMKWASDRLNPAIDATAFAEPTIPVVTNVDGKPHSTAAEIIEQLKLQMTCSVQWIQTVRSMTGAVDSMVEVGPGKVLAGLAKRINKDLPVQNAGTLAEVQQLVASSAN